MKQKISTFCVVNEKIDVVNHVLVVFILLFLMPVLICAQTKSISGKILDQKTGDPLVGVSISVQGHPSTGTISDVDGKFSLNVPLNSILEVNYVGYKSQSVSIPGNGYLEIKMTEENRTLEEVVVVGYGTQKKSDVTGSLVSIPKSRLEKLPVTNVLQSIQGVAAGVNITQASSVPGDAPTAIIRGRGSINASTDPYVVVDGVPISKTGGTLNDVNPNDIASIEILKDASAVAIYGTNGANGVILITTKRGMVGKPKISYNGYYGVEDMAHVLKPRSGPEYVQKYLDYCNEAGITPTYNVPNYGEVGNYEKGITTDWLDFISRTGMISDNNVSISGASEKTKYYVSMGYMKENGVLKGYQLGRVNLRTNLDMDLTDFLTVGTSMFITSSNTDGGRANMLVATAMSPYGQPYNADGSYKIYPMYPEQLYGNPLLPLTTDVERRSFNVTLNGYALVKFGGVLKGLTYKLNGGYTYLPTRNSSYTGRQSNDMVGTADETRTESDSYTLENILAYTREIGVHHFDLTGLYSAQQQLYNWNDAHGVGFISDALSFHDISAAATQTANSYQSLYRANSQMGRLNYSYASRYLLTFTVRRDGSSVFGSNRKYGVFPSLALGWNISNENFMKNIKWLDNLKLRISRGLSGNEAIGVYQTLSTLSTNSWVSNGTTFTTLVASKMANNNLGWEKTLSNNIGLDFGVLNGRISGSVDVYKSNTSNLLLQRQIPNITGYSSVWDNIGKTENKGIDITINTNNVNLKDFGWTSGITFSSNQNKILDLYGDGKDDITNGWFIGHPIGVIYDYKVIGVWQKSEIDAGDQKKSDPTAVAGDLKFQDVNKDGQITAADKVIQGQTDPKWIGGFTNTFRYKNLNLSVFFQTAQGMKKYNADLNYYDESFRRNTPKEVGYWTLQNESNVWPALTYKNTLGYGYPRDASYVRLKDITLSYIFNDSNLLNKIGMSALTVYASGRNIYTWTKWIGWDPESRQISRGSTYSDINYPVVRSIVLGINLTLK